MVAPTYYLAAGIFKGSNHSAELNVDCGYSKRISGIPEDDEGLDISVLQSQIDKLEQGPEFDLPYWQKWTYRYVFYGVPTFSNPTGSIMSLERRIKLLTVLSPLRKFHLLTLDGSKIQYASNHGRCIRSVNIYI